MVNFSENIKKLRQQQHMTQKELAERIGISKAMISAYETEMRYPSYDVLIKLATIFNVTTEWLEEKQNKDDLKKERKRNMKDSAFSTRIENMNEILKKEGIGCFLVTPSSDMKYLCGYSIKVEEFYCPGEEGEELLDPKSVV